MTEPVPAESPAPECTASALVDDDGTLICTLPAGHGGLHFDAYDGVSWKWGGPDGV